LGFTNTFQDHENGLKAFAGILLRAATRRLELISDCFSDKMLTILLATQGHVTSVDNINKAPQLDEIVTRLVAAFNPHSIVLFGSWVTGNATADSDVDLLVVAESDEPLHIRMAQAQRALRGLTVPVDVFVYTPAEVERFGQWLSHTVAIALREGRKLYAA
jgi:predicted nucleotidyltransferase